MEHGESWTNERLIQLPKSGKKREKIGKKRGKEGNKSGKREKIGKALSLCPSWQIVLALLLVSSFHYFLYLKVNFDLERHFIYNFIFGVVNLDPIILEKRWIGCKSWPNDFVRFKIPFDECIKPIIIKVRNGPGHLCQILIMQIQFRVFIRLNHSKIRLFKDMSRFCSLSL